MADKIIPFPDEKERKKRDDPYTWFIHECVGVEFALRSDGVIICKKCGEEIGWYTLNGNDD